MDLYTQIKQQQRHVEQSSKSESYYLRLARKIFTKIESENQIILGKFELFEEYGRIKLRSLTDGEVLLNLRPPEVSYVYIKLDMLLQEKFEEVFSNAVEALISEVTWNSVEAMKERPVKYAQPRLQKTKSQALLKASLLYVAEHIDENAGMLEGYDDANTNSDEIYELLEDLCL